MPGTAVARIAAVAVMAVLAAPSARAQSTVLGGINTGASFYSGYRFNTHYANGYYWTAFKDGTCATAGRLRVYSSANGTAWAQATGSPAFSFCPLEGEWAVRFLGNVVVAFAYNGTGGTNDQRRYYHKGTLNSDGSVTWSAAEDNTVAAAGGTDIKLNAAIVNGKPVLWQADAASPGRVTIGSALDSPTWNTYVNPTARTAGLPNNGSNGQFSAGAVFPLYGADPNDFIIIRATSAAGLIAQGHRVVTIKFNAGPNTFDAVWYNVSTLENSPSTAVPPDATLPLPEDATTNVSLGATDDVVQSRFAAAQMSDGIIHVVYVNQNGNPIHYRRGAGFYNEVSLDTADKPLWTQHFNDANNIDGGATAVDKVGLTVIDSNNLYLFYSRVGGTTLYYRRFDGRGWGAEAPIASPGVPVNYSFGTMETATGCKAGVAWNEGTTNPYTVKFRLVNPSCTAPAVFYRSIGTAGNYTQGQVIVTNSTTVDGTGAPAPAWQSANRGLGDVIVIPCSNPPTCTLPGGATAYTIASVNTETRLILTTAFTGTPGTYPYLIQRQFQSTAGNAAPALLDWETCIDGGITGTSCNYAAGGTRPTAHNFNPAAASSGNLVIANRVEVGVLYKDSVITPVIGGHTAIRGTETSATHRIVLTVAPGNRHNGTPAAALCTTNCASVVYDGGSLGRNGLRITDANVTVSWIEFRNFRGWVSGDPSDLAPIEVTGSSDTTLGATFPTGTEAPQNTVLSHLLIHDFTDADNTVDWVGIRLHSSCCKSMTVRNTMIWDGDKRGIEGDEAGDTYLVENTTVDYMHGFDSSGNPDARGIETADSVVIVRNTIATSNTANRDFYLNGLGAFSSLSSNNISSTGTPPGTNPQTVTLAELNDLYVTPANPGPGNLHLEAGVCPSSAVVCRAVNQGLDLSSSFVNDVDSQARPAGAWDRGADERDATTAVRLTSFEAAGLDGAVELAWRTGSELDNLGFHVYRSAADAGPWTRITASLVPGLVSSAVGQAYSFRDTGLVNGTLYFYRLEDVDASSKTTSHGPVSAVPTAGAVGSVASAGGPSDGTVRNKRGGAFAACPDWVLSAYGSFVGASSSASLGCTRHGDPEAVSLGIVSRDSRSATLELRTGGFYALHEPSGGVRVFVPGFDFPQDPQAAALPFRRALVDAVVGRRAQLGGVRVLDQVGFAGLVPSSLGKAEMQVSRDGTVRAGRRAVRALGPQRVSADLARLLPSVFQGETKSAVVEISPLRFDARRQQLVLARRVRVRLLFTGRETAESGRGSVGRSVGSRAPLPEELLARLYTTNPGLHAVSFDALFPGRRRGLVASSLRLERQGQAHAFHLEPASDSFGPGGVLYFYADTTAGSTDFSSETAWELVSSGAGAVMPLVSAAPGGDPVSSPSTGQAIFEVNRYYQSGLLEAPDLWLWEGLASGVTRAKSFSLVGVDTAGVHTAVLDVALQGASESGNPVDHHVSVAVNGALVGEARFAGKRPYRMSLSLPVSLLREGANELTLTNVADTGVSSFVFLDRFGVSFPQTASLASGLFEGTWTEGGTATLAGLTGPTALLDVTAGGATGGGALWLTGYEATGASLRFRAEAGHRYLAVSQPMLLAPRVVAPSPSSLRSAENQADYLLIAPRAFLAEAEPLVARRQDQGLAARAVAFEEIADEFGHGQPSAEAIKGFLAFAFHSWARPSPRYVLLLGDSSYDPRNFTGTAKPSPLPALWTKTSYLWTVSDPGLAAVNGVDSLPDLAIGRLPATTVEQARTLVEKLIAWEDSGQRLTGGAALVADNPDLAGDFEADVQDIARSFLAERNPQLLLLRELGAGTRPAIREALDSGLSFLSYVGHGGAAVWASENVWNAWDVESLQAQSQQPLLLTLNCLNGYFVVPAYDSLAESLLKAEGRGAIAGFSPSGLSLDGPAHQYHRALMAEITGGQHERLGDALLAAQKTYAQSGLMPELLAVYHLLGDPALRIR